MNRTDKYEKGKISKASTNKVVTNVYFDAFSIEKVRFQNANYADKTSIECYLDFEEIAILATDAANGRLFKELENGQKTVSMGGSKSSKRFDGAPESRIMSLGRAGDKIFINMSAGKGRLGDTGLIIPDGAPDKKISVSMSIEKFRSMIIYTYDCVKGYLPKMINNIVNELEEDRKNYLATSNKSNLSNAETSDYPF